MNDQWYNDFMHRLSDDINARIINYHLPKNDFYLQFYYSDNHDMLVAVQKTVFLNVVFPSLLVFFLLRFTWFRWLFIVYVHFCILPLSVPFIYKIVHKNKTALARRDTQSIHESKANFSYDCYE